MSKSDKHELGKIRSRNYVTGSVKYIAQQYPYLKQSNGADHFWFSTHDGGATRGFLAEDDFNTNSIGLVHSADVLMGYTPCKDISLIPNCDFDRPPTKEERAELFSDSHNRKSSVFFAGNLASNKLRQEVKSMYQDDDLFYIVDGRIDDVDYIEQLKTSQFCLHLRGFQVWSPRLIEYIWYGCIPIVLGDDYYLPMSSLLDWREFSIIIKEDHASSIKQTLLSISNKQIRKMRRRLAKVAPHFIYNDYPVMYDAFYMTMAQLYIRNKQLKGQHLNDDSKLCDKKPFKNDD